MRSLLVLAALATLAAVVVRADSSDTADEDTAVHKDFPYEEARAKPKIKCDVFEGCGAADVPFFKAAPYKFTSNGCGTSGFQVSVDPAMAPCCDVHDACYSICNITRTFCDTQFSKCLRAKCASIGGDSCHNNAQMLSMGASSFGCAAFQDAQRAACTCRSLGDELDDSVRAFWRALYAKAASVAPKTDAEVDAIADKALAMERPAVRMYSMIDKYAEVLVAREGRDEL